jgi:hypothetical protein
MFKDDWLQHDDVPEELIEQVSIGVDPSGGGDEVGIVVGALLTDGCLAVLADRTISATPGQWGDEVVRAHDEFDADDVVVEVNFGGDMATEVIKAAADRAHRLGKRESSSSLGIGSAGADDGDDGDCDGDGGDVGSGGDDEAAAANEAAMASFASASSASDSRRASR